MRPSRSRSIAFTAPGIDPMVSLPPANWTSVPLILGDPSRRRVAIVRCLRERISLRTRDANSGCCASKSAQPAIRKETTLEAPMAELGPPAASAENAFAAHLFEGLPARYDLLAEVLSLGQNANWRHELVQHIARMKPRRVLRPGGARAGLDFYVPPGALWRMSWRLYTRALMPGAGFVLGGRAWWKAGRFLGPNIEAFHRRWPMDRLFEAWREAGMVDVEDEGVSLGGGLVMWGQKHHA